MKKLLIFLTIISFYLTPQLAFAAPKPTINLSDAIIADLALRNYLDNISIYFQDKKSPNTVTLNLTKQWLPASTVKLFVALYAFNQIAEKNISLNQWVTIEDKNVVPTELETDDYPVLTPGLTTTVDTLIKKMITQSDNTAYNTLLDILDRQNVTEYVQHFGMIHTIVGSKLNLDDNQTQYEFTTPGYNINTTTAEDYAKAYDLLDTDKLPGSQQLLRILSHQKINTMLPAYLPSTLTIEHKTGDLDPLYHDGGIVVGNNHHYILTIFSNLGNPNIIAHISQLIYTKNYSLVGSAIPEKDNLSKPNGIQAIDPLLLQKVTSTVLAAQSPINVPLPSITAADLGISEKDISLAIPLQNLPKPFLPPWLNTLWYGVQKALVISEKARQDVALSYAKSELGRASDLTKQGKTTEATQILSLVSEVLKEVAKDKTAPPDQATQVAIKALSDTRFSVMHQQLVTAKNDDARAQLIQTIAQTARTHLAEIEPHLGDAKAATNLAQKPVVGKIVEATSDHIVVETSGGQQITIPLTKNIKIKDDTVRIPTPSITTSPTISPSQEISPISSTPQLLLKKGETIAVLGSTKGRVITPSLIVHNIPREIAAPHPVVAVKINPKENTMVVSDNGNLIQVDLTTKTAIKAKDTNLKLQSIKPGSVVVVHGDIVEPVYSDSPVTVPTTQPTVEKTGIPSLSPTIKPKTITPTKAMDITPSQSPATEKATAVPSEKNSLPGQQISPIKNITIAPTAIPSATIQTTPKAQTSPSQPEVIRATSIQVIQQPSSSKQSSPSQPAAQPPQQKSNSSQPAPQQQEKTIQQPAQNTSSQKGKGNGK